MWSENLPDGDGKEAENMPRKTSLSGEKTGKKMRGVPRGEEIENELFTNKKRLAQRDSGAHGV